MNRIARVCGKGIFKGSAFIATCIIFVVVFVAKPKLINLGLDDNLSLIKTMASIVEARAPWWGDSFEAFSRFFNLERVLLFTEVVVVVKLLMLAVGRIFRRCHTRVRAWRPNRNRR